MLNDSKCFRGALCQPSGSKRHCLRAPHSGLWWWSLSHLIDEAAEVQAD